MDELWKLESVDTAESRKVASRFQTRLKASREPTLLNELVELYFKTGSKRARKILTTLRETHSQDFFDKLDDSLAITSTRLPALKLLAHTLNSQTSWLYRIVDHPLFTSILDQLKTSGDVVVLSNALFVVSAILPMVPSYIGNHLQDIFAIFCELATLRATNRLGLTPKELHLHLDVAVYYFFMQLYALFPCNLSQFLRAHYAHSSQEEVAKFQEHIVPLFYQVQLHPGLITGGEKYELSKAKWGAMEPLDIATLSLQLCLDSNLAAVQQGKPSGPQSAQHQHQSTYLHQESPGLALTTRTAHSDLSHSQLQEGRCGGFDDALTSMSNVSRELVKTPSTPLFLSHSVEAGSSLPQPSENTEMAAAPTASSMSSCDIDLNLSSTQVLSGLPDPGGLKTPQELNLFWSPSVTLGNTLLGKSISHDSSRTSLTQQSLQPSTISSPISDSALSSAQPTPGPTSTSTAFTFKNYSPTASVDGESLISRQMVQSAIHTPSMLEDSHSSSSLEPLSQSVRVDLSFRSSTGTGSGLNSPSQSLISGHGSRSQLSGSFRARLGRFINFLSPKKSGEEGEGFSELSSTAENEEFIEINVSDLEREQQRSHKAGLTGEWATKRGILTGRSTASQRARRKIEVGEECLVTEADTGEQSEEVLDRLLVKEGADTTTNSRTDMTSADVSRLMVDKVEASTVKSDEDMCSRANDLLNISSLPDSSSMLSRFSRQSSQASSNGVDRAEPPDSTHNPVVAEVNNSENLHRGCATTKRGMASSVPERGTLSSVPWMHHSRSCSSNSDHTVLMVQERLQELVELEKNSSFADRGENVIDDNSSTVATEQSAQHQLIGKRPTTLNVTSNDSTVTLRVQSEDDLTSECSREAMKPSSADAVLHPRHHAMTMKLPTKSSTLPAFSSSLPSQHFVRRVSVCQPDNHLTASVDQLSSPLTNQIQSSGVERPSPLSLLDQFVTRGEVLHRGQFESIPLTELEGVDWNHFGGCPHSEEFVMMRSQVALLHSQLLFERHQCLQHARRNRRLLSRARQATQVAEKLYELRDQLHQKEQLVMSLREQLQELTGIERASNAQQKLSRENQMVMAQNAQLREANLCLSEEAYRLKQNTGRLQQELKHTKEELVRMEDERRHMEPKLRRADQLQNEVDTLSCELQVLGELYQQQREEAQELRMHSQREHDLGVLCTSLVKEKEATQKTITSLSQQLQVSLSRSQELEQIVSQREEELASLQQKLNSVQGRHQAKMKALQDKYTSIVAIGQQLETQILELRGRPAHHKKKNTTRHKRSSSHPTVPLPHNRAPSTTAAPSKFYSPSLTRAARH